MSEYNVIQIDENSFRIETDLVRSYLFIGTQSAMLVDTTNINGNLSGLVKDITNLPVMLVNTHTDPDHIACNEQFEFACMHPAEFAQYKLNKKENDAPSKAIFDRQIIDLGNRPFEVIHIPGHTCGSIALLDKINRVLISGDTVSKVPVFMFGTFRNLRATQYSYDILKKRAAEYDFIYTSHGEYKVTVNQIDNLIKCSEELLMGNLSPEEPFFPISAKMYRLNDAAFYYDPEDL